MHRTTARSLALLVSQYTSSCARVVELEEALGTAQSEVADLRGRVQGLRHAVASEYEGTVARLTAELDQVSARARSLVGGPPAVPSPRHTGHACAVPMGD